MNDLISRSELLKTLRDRASENAIMGYLTAYDVTNSIIDDVNEQPIAYDIDKVVEELQKIEDHCLEMNDWQGQSAVVDAIEIVKRGGVTDIQKCDSVDCSCMYIDRSRV